MRVTLALLASLVALALPSAASADATPTFPGQRLAHNPNIERWYSFGEGFWADRGLTPCRNPTIYIADYLGERVNAMAWSGTCELWILADFVREAQHPRAIRRTYGQMKLCLIVLHEGWHEAGMHFHLDHGIAQSSGSTDDEIEMWDLPSGRTRAVGRGACGVEAARQFNNRAGSSVDRHRHRK